MPAVIAGMAPAAIGQNGGVTEGQQERRDGRAARRPRPGGGFADVFGDVLPETTSDEREPEDPTRTADDWYRENRPPHHDRS